MKKGKGISQRIYMYNLWTQTTCGDGQREGGVGAGREGS